MKRSSVVIIILFALSFGCRTHKTLSDNQTVMEQIVTNPVPTDFHEASTWLLGYFTRRMMTIPPHSEWFQKGYDEYQLNEEAVKKLTEISKDDLTIKIVMGSWCPDSRREVPRFMKIIDTWDFPAENLTFVGVDESKYSPIGEYDKLNIQRVPTFIFYKNNIEAGRIIENPVTSLEQDMVNILTRE
jgi:thiol-disulfide isomerase/thioredoxin